MGEVVDLFGGPGGWDLGARLVGVDPLGIEYDEDACATRAAAGLRTIRADVSTVALEHLAEVDVEGIIASPPCTAFSTAGKGKGRALLAELVTAVEAGDWSARPDPDPTVWLVLEVGRWVEALQPEWIACEQVPSVLPIWQAYTRWLEQHGYSAWAGRLSAEQYGVAQTRQRAFLLAHRSRSVGPPTPTHQRYVARGDDNGRLGLLLPWVSMAEALGWDGRVGFPRNGDRAGDGEFRERDLRDADDPAAVVTEKARSWTVRASGQENAAERELDEPAPTIVGGKDGASLRVNTGRDWKPDGDRSGAQTRSVEDPAPAIDGKGRWHVGDDNGDGAAPRPPAPPVPQPAPEGQDSLWPERVPGLPEHGVTAEVADRKAWASERPATTVAGRALVPDPGQNANRFNKATKSRNDGIRVSIEDVLVLQSFPRDYPLVGNRTSIFRQAGNAIPPLLAAHVLASLLGVDAPTSTSGLPDA